MLLSVVGLASGVRSQEHSYARYAATLRENNAQILARAARIAADHGRASSERLSCEAEVDQLTRSRADLLEQSNRDLAERKRRADTENKALMREAGDLAAQIEALTAEMEKALEELRLGRYCSQCNRPAS